MSAVYSGGTLKSVEQLIKFGNVYVACLAIYNRTKI